MGISNFLLLSEVFPVWNRTRKVVGSQLDALTRSFVRPVSMMTHYRPHELQGWPSKGKAENMKSLTFKDLFTEL